MLAFFKLKSIILKTICAVFIMVPPAFALAPNCGDIDRDIVQDVYKDARDIRFTYDIRPEIEQTCDVFENLQEWEDKKPRSYEWPSDYTQKKGVTIQEVEALFKQMQGKLTLLRVWLRVEPHGKIKKLERVARIKDAYKDLESYVSSLKEWRQSATSLKSLD